MLEIEQNLYEWLEKWLSVYVKARVKPNTYANYRYAANLIGEYMGNPPLSCVTELSVQQLLNRLLDEDFARSTIRIVRIALNQAFEMARRNRIVLYNPVTYTEIPRSAPQKEICALTLRQQKRLEKACLADPSGHLFLFLLYTGLRRIELINLRWSDYDARTGQLHISVSKTDAGQRTIPLLPLCAQIIALQPKINGYIFNTPRGQQLTDGYLRSAYGRLRKTAGIPTLTNHVCRHSFATRLIEQGADPKAVSTLLGHTSVQFTLNHYVCAQNDHLRSQVMLLQPISLTEPQSQ